MIRRVAAFIVFFLCCHLAIAQRSFVFEGKVEDDRGVLGYSFISLKEPTLQGLTDSVGYFKFSLPDSFATITFTVRVPGIKYDTVLKPGYGKSHIIHIPNSGHSLDEVVIKGLTARDVLLKAVKLIPENYMAQSYFSYGYARKYTKVNKQVCNLMEASMIQMRKMEKDKTIHDFKDSYAIRNLRRSTYTSILPLSGDGELDELFLQDPVYFLDRSSLSSFNVRKMDCSFDTTLSDSLTYAISYLRNGYTSDFHGIANYCSVLIGECYEYGTIFIDRASLAIKRITRKSKRHPAYVYGDFNFVKPTGKYRFEFVDGYTEVDYSQVEGKWYPSRIVYTYSNNFMLAADGMFSFNQQEYFEYYGDSVSRLVDGEWANRFYENCYLTRRHYKYDPQYWGQQDYPYFFDNPVSLYSELGKYTSLWQQFIDEGKKE